MVWITHPDLPGSLQQVVRSAFERVLAPRGWKETASPEEEARQVQIIRQEMDTSSSSVTEVLDEVGDDPVKAQAALAVERDGKNRTTLITALERIANPEGD